MYVREKEKKKSPDMSTVYEHIPENINEAFSSSVI